MLSSLQIENFKGIKSGTLSNLSQVNVLVGRNNSGKSTVLDALLLMRCAFATDDYLGRLGLRQVRDRKDGSDRGEDFRELAYLLNTQEPITIRAGLSDSGLGDIQAAQLSDGESQCTLAQEWMVGPSFISTSLSLESPGYVVESGSYSPLVASIGQLNNNSASQWLYNQIDVKIANFVIGAYLLESSSIRIPTIEMFWERMVTGKRRDLALKDMINDIYKLKVDGFNLMPFGGRARLVALLPEGGVAVDWLGDGVRYALNILALGMLLEGTILMVEEPETHQHPESLKLLTQTLFELAKQQDLQLFLTTHSWEFMSYAIDAAKEKGVELVFHHLYLDAHGNLDARAISQPDAELLMDIGHDIRSNYKYMGVE